MLSLIVFSYLSISLLSLAVHLPYAPAPKTAYLPTATPTPASLSTPPLAVQRRQSDAGYPTFPPDVVSCPICEQNYASLSSCAAAAPVLANYTMIIFNPGAFIDVIKCACTDTFESYYPQCVDCFERTNQTQFLNDSSADLSSVVSGMRTVCAVAATLFGNVSEANSEVSLAPALTATAAAPLSTSGAQSVAPMWPRVAWVFVVAKGLGGLGAIL